MLRMLKIYQRLKQYLPNILIIILTPAAPQLATDTLGTLHVGSYIQDDEPDHRVQAEGMSSPRLVLLLRQGGHDPQTFASAYWFVLPN